MRYIGICLQSYKKKVKVNCLSKYNIGNETHFMTTYTHKHDILYISWPSQDSQSCIVSQWEFLYFPRKVSKYQLFSLECHINCLGFSMRKSPSLKVLVKYFAIIGAISVLPNRYLIITWASVLTNGSSLSFSST